MKIYLYPKRLPCLRPRFSFDDKRSKRTEALAADREDLNQLEEIEKKLLENRGKSNE